MGSLASPASTVPGPRRPTRPLLSREQELALMHRVRQGGRDARNELIMANLGFVTKIAGEYRNLGMPFEDLLHEGYLGLIEAARRYDVSRGARFLTCAVWWIRKAILRALDEHSGVIRVPATQRRRIRQMQRVEQQLFRALGRAPRREELSRDLSCSATSVDEIRRSAAREIRLDDRVRPGSESSFMELLTDGTDPGPERELLRREASRMVGEAMARLSPRERLVIRHRFGFGDERPRALKEVGEILGVSRERVRQIESGAIRRMHRFLARARFAREGAPASRQSGGRDVWAVRQVC